MSNKIKVQLTDVEIGGQFYIGTVIVTKLKKASKLLDLVECSIDDNEPKILIHTNAMVFVDR